ncbi:MAG: putative manganese transporter, partial [Pseudomonadota bacterium]
LLIAAEPVTAMYVLGISLLGGMVTGMVVDMIHGPNFLRMGQKEDSATASDFSETGQTASMVMKRLEWFAFLVMLPGMVVGGMMAFQIEIPPDLENGLGLVGIFSLVAVWTGLNGRIPIANFVSDEGGYSLISRVIEDTAFITIWVVVAFFLFEFAVNVLDLDLKGLFTAVGWTLPLMGVLVGFLPGCGPQIIVTTLYLNGFIPLSAQIGNAISNDGDALFPAIAVAPKAAIIATLYSAIPAMIISYSYFFLFE